LTAGDQTDSSPVQPDMATSTSILNGLCNQITYFLLQIALLPVFVDLAASDRTLEPRGRTDVRQQRVSRVAARSSGRFDNSSTDRSSQGSRDDLTGSTGRTEAHSRGRSPATHTAYHREPAALDQSRQQQRSDDHPSVNSSRSGLDDYQRSSSTHPRYSPGQLENEDALESTTSVYGDVTHANPTSSWADVSKDRWMTENASKGHMVDVSYIVASVIRAVSNTMESQPRQYRLRSKS
jgi:hypothetical protein